MGASKKGIVHSKPEHVKNNSLKVVLVDCVLVGIVMVGVVGIYSPISTYPEKIVAIEVLVGKASLYQGPVFKYL